MSVSLAYALKMTTTETLSANVPDATAPTVKHDGFDTSGTLNASSTPPVSKMASFQKALSGGAATIDLTALLGTNGATVDFSTLKVQAYKFRNPEANANAITVTFGASNAYLLHGSAFKFILQPGDEICFKGLNTAPTVGSGAKNIDLAGTGSQALDVILIAG